MKSLSRRIQERLKINKNFKGMKYTFDEMEKIVDKYCVPVNDIATVLSKIAVNAADCHKDDFISDNKEKIVKLVDMFWHYKNCAWWLDIYEQNMTEGTEIIRDLVNDCEQDPSYDWTDVYKKNDNSTYEFKVLITNEFSMIVCGVQKFRRIFIAFE